MTVLPPALAAAAAGFARHLEFERGRSPHTVRAYVGDVAMLLEHAARLGVQDPAQIDLAVLRSWLARLRSSGVARATMARRGSSARVFTAWATRRGLLAADPGALLATPRGHRPLPEVLQPDEAARLVDGVDGGTTVDVRDRVALELLYGTGIRVAELCGLDLDDVDRGRRVVRVLGKGSRERSVPYGVPAEAALGTWLTQGRPVWARPGSGPALLLGRRGGGSTRARSGRSCTLGSPRCRGRPAWARTGCGTAQRHICWKGAPTCAASRNSSVTLLSRRPRSTRMSASSG